MLRIRFTAEDLARVRLSGVMDPMWEIVGSVQMLQTPQPAPFYDRWLTRAKIRLQDPKTKTAARALASIAPLRSYFPDFLTPDRASRGLDEDIETVLRTPVRRLQSEIAELGKPTGWLAMMASGDPSAVGKFGDILRCYYQEMIAPEQPAVESQLAAHRGSVMQRLTESGTESMLSGLAPMIRWKPPYLEASYPHDRTIDLAGRGLQLVPSYFCTRRPVALADANLSPVLVYPVDHAVGGPGCDGLAALIGGTRSDVLKATLGGGSTSDVSERVGISVATASHHTSILRNAGLVSSARTAHRVVHRPTSLGLAMLAGGIDRCS